MPTTRGRSRRRQGVRSRTPGPAGEHLPKIMTALVTGSIVIVLTLVMTKAGRDIDAATQRFMLYYAGVFALIGLTASVGVGLVATDRIIMTPAHRVMAQAVHKAVSFVALAFLVIHIVTEILAQRVHVIDAFIPFLSPYRTFYIGLGTIASDLILLVVVTSIFRKRFATHGKAWRWRAIHYTSYAAFVLGVMHGLLGGRAAKPYVDWSYGFAIALTALAIATRFLAISLRPKKSLSAHPPADRAPGRLGYQGASPLHAAALGMAQAQLGGTVQVLPATAGTQATSFGLAGSPGWAALPPAPGWSPHSGPFPAISAPPVYAAESSSGAYREPELMPLGAPAYGDGTTIGAVGYPYAAVEPPRSAQVGPGPAGRAIRQPRYEPEYDGPPRFEGAPREHVPQDEVSSYPYGPQSYRRGAGYAGHERGSRPPAGQAAGSGSARPSRPARSSRPDRDPGPMPRAGTGPVPRVGPGPTSRPAIAPTPRAGTGPMPRAGNGQTPYGEAGPVPRAGTGPIPRAGAGSAGRAGTGGTPRPGTASKPRNSAGSRRRAGSEPISRTGPSPVPDSGSRPYPGSAPGAGGRPSPRADSADPAHRDTPGRAGGAGWT